MSSSPRLPDSLQLARASRRASSSPLSPPPSSSSSTPPPLPSPPPLLLHAQSRLLALDAVDTAHQSFRGEVLLQFLVVCPRDICDEADSLGDADAATGGSSSGGERSPTASDGGGGLAEVQQKPALQPPPPPQRPGFLRRGSLPGSPAPRHAATLVELLPLRLVNFLGSESDVHRWVQRHEHAPDGAREGFAWDSSTHVCFSLWLQARGDFSQSFDLRSFPLDDQLLRIDLMLSRSASAARFATAAESAWLPKKRHLMAVVSSRAAALLEFFVVDRVAHSVYRSRPEASGTATPRSFLEVAVPVQRLVGHYLLSIVLPNFLIASCIFLASALSPTAALASRTGLLSGLLMTILGFRYVALSYLPRVSYPTLIDYYLTLCLVFVIAALVEVAIVVPCTDSASLLRSDAIAWACIAAAWAIANGAALALYLTAVWRRTASAGGRILSVEISPTGKNGYLVVQRDEPDEPPVAPAAAAKEAPPPVSGAAIALTVGGGGA